MSWIQTLYETAIVVEGLRLKESDKPWPVAHMAKKAHLEVTINNKGSLLDIKILSGNEAITIIPTTEESANRTNSIAPHPLCEELGYCAKDLPGNDEKRYQAMKVLMEGWLASTEYAHPKVRAVFTYLEKGHLYTDLALKNIFPFKTTNYKGVKTAVETKKVFVRWRVHELDNPCSGTWEDSSLIESWIAYDNCVNDRNGFCMLQGESARIAKSHSRFLRTSDDGAKLISSNDNIGFTFRGRFTDNKYESGRQACTIGYIASQKAHNVLRWLVARQGYRKINNEFGKCFIAWAVSCKDIPDPYANSFEFLGQEAELIQPTTISIGDVGQSFALRLNKKIAGYKGSIQDNEAIVVMGLDSATPGRLAITFYRKLCGSTFLKRITHWHSDFAWYQNFGKELHFVGAPAPKDIAWAAYGKKVEGKDGTKLLNATIERLLPCIIDGAQFPNDLAVSSSRRATNRVGMDRWEWEKCLGIACAVYRGLNISRRFSMSLEVERTTRDYLYGRLLAVAERIESIALFYAKEKRDTTAARLMQRFSDRPFSTWRTIETALVPYEARINSKVPGLLVGFKELLDEIHSLFVGDDYLNDGRLSGEFLLGYHCQRKWLSEHKRKEGSWILKEASEIEIQETGFED